MGQSARTMTHQAHSLAPGFAVASAWIHVGSMTVAGWAVSYEGDTVAKVLVLREAFDWVGRQVGRVRDLTPDWLPKNRCHDMRCRVWIWDTVENEGALGWSGYCQTCLDGFIDRCRRAHGRLPRLKTEFYCPRCGEMRAHPEDRCRQERDGRQRATCRLCRNAAQLERWKARYRNRPAELRVDGE